MNVQSTGNDSLPYSTDNAPPSIFACVCDSVFDMLNATSSKCNLASMFTFCVNPRP